MANIDKLMFFCLLASIDKSKKWGYRYDKEVNDPMSSRHHVKRSASYVFYLVSDDGQCKEITSGKAFENT